MTNGSPPRRLLPLALAATMALLVLGATGCGRSEPPTTTTTTAPPTTTTTSTTTSTTTTTAPPPVYWPLTGLQAPDEATTRARVVSVKVENSKAARPQSNLDRADVIYESITEGGITRFNALYHSSAPDSVGPVRSARLSDLYIVPQYDALFAHVGGNTDVRSGIRRGDIDDLDQFAHSSPYWRVKSRKSPHNVYTSIEKLREVGAGRGFAAEQEVRGLEFDDPESEPPAAVTDPALLVSRIVIPYSSATVAEWTYDPATRTYLRSHAGRAHVDAVSEQQYRAANVVVLWARVIPQSQRDAAGSITYDIKLVGDGQAALFRDGRRIDCRWKAAADRPPVLRAADGAPVTLAPGVTWFQVVSTATAITSE